jgi:hypothetical protein
VQEQVHQTQASGSSDDLVAKEGLVLEKLLLPFIQTCAPSGQPFIGAEEETASAAGRVGDGLAGFGLHTLDHRLDQNARSEVLAGAALGVFGVLL